MYDFSASCCFISSLLVQTLGLVYNGDMRRLKCVLFYTVYAIRMSDYLQLCAALHCFTHAITINIINRYVILALSTGGQCPT
jgi:hypothetical protein